MAEDSKVSAQEEFWLQAYALHSERNSKSQEQRWNFIQYSIVGIFAFYAGLVGFREKLAISVVNVAVWIPFALSILGIFHAWALRQSSVERGRAMTNIEKRFGGKGWQADEGRAERLQIIRHPLTTISYIYWSFMLFVSLFTAISMNFQVFYKQ